MEQQSLDGGLEQVDQIVVAANVREFMGENGSQLQFAQAGEGGHGQENVRAEPTDDRGSFGEGGGVEADDSRDAEAARHIC